MTVLNEVGDGDENYYANYKVLFSQEGWKQLDSELRKEIYQIQADALEAKDWDTVCKMRGRAEAYAFVLGLPDVLETLQNEKKDANLQLPLQSL